MKLQRKTLHKKTFGDMESLNKWLSKEFDRINVLTISCNGDWDNSNNIFYYII